MRLFFVCVDVSCETQNFNLPCPLLFGLVGDAVSRHELVKHHDSDKHVHLRDTEDSFVRFGQQGCEQWKCVCLTVYIIICYMYI